MGNGRAPCGRVCFEVVGQRICRYPGQYAPEVLEDIDETTLDANPEYVETITDKVAMYKNSAEFSSIGMLTTYVKTSDIEKILNPPCQVSARAIF